MIELHILLKEEYQSMKETRWIKTVEKEGKIKISRETKHAQQGFLFKQKVLYGIIR
jgi:hypothetical protein